MNPNKVDVLKKLDEAARVHDAALEQSLNVVTNPGQFGWRKSLLTAAVVVPLTGVSAVLTDMSRVLLSRSDDDVWERKPPPAEIPPKTEAP